MTVRKVDGVEVDADTFDGLDRLGKAKLGWLADKLLKGAGVNSD
ncbi:unnamed protein product, partial [marine sediment metagenome]